MVRPEDLPAGEAWPEGWLREPFGLWVVHTKGGPGKESFEIAVCRENNRLAFESYGHFGEAKLLVSHNGGPCRWPVTDRIWAGLVKLAEEVAAELNEAEERW